MIVNGMSISEDSFGDVSSLLDQVDLLTVQTAASYEVSHEKFSSIYQQSKEIYFRYSSRDSVKEGKNHIKRSDIEALPYSERENSRCLPLLREERNDYLTELVELKSTLHMLAIDSSNLECEKKRRQELENRKKELESVISKKECIIKDLQETNRSLEEDNRQFVRELIEALKEDGVVLDDVCS